MNIYLKPAFVRLFDHVFGSSALSVPYRNERLGVFRHLGISDETRRFTVFIPISRKPYHGYSVEGGIGFPSRINTTRTTANDLGYMIT